MNCKECGECAQFFVDEELDSRQTTEVQSHLSQCETCSRRVGELKSLKKALRSKSLHYAAPAALRERLINQMGSAESAPQKVVPVVFEKRTAFRFRFFAAAAAACIALCGFAFYHGVNQSKEGALAEEVMSAHIRSLMATHLSDVASSDNHTVKPWFVSKLDYSPAVQSFPDQEFPLIGGRLDYIHRRPVAALVYQHHKHFVNVFSWPTAENEAALAETSSAQGFNLIAWRKAGMTNCIVSELNMVELNKLADLLKQ